VLFAVAFAIVAAAPASAANKEHQQMMADLRMLQEQAQLLQTLLGSVTDALKAVNTRLDQQTEVNRKAFADSKLVMDNLTNDVRVIREKLDDNNVRIGSLTQEVDAMRQSLQNLGARPSTTPEQEAATGGGAATTPGATSTSAMSASPKQVWDAAYADYTAGQYDLAVLGFDSFIKSFPKADQADDAQVYIGNSYLGQGKYDKAVEAYDLAIRTYPTGNAIPEAYFKKGVALLALKNVNGAREAWEYVSKNAPDSAAGQQAKQRLEQFKKP